MKIYAHAMAATMGLALLGCNATTGTSSLAAGESRASTEATACLAGDQSVSNSGRCLQDDAACYPIADGSWCTGPRASNCPMGSMPLPAELPCPEGTRCFSQSESLQCAIGG